MYGRTPDDPFTSVVHHAAGKFDVCNSDSRRSTPFPTRSISSGRNIEEEFTTLAEAMPEDKWSFKPIHGEFKDVRNIW
jgi:hypothetical protein